MCQIDLEKLERRYVMIEMLGKPFRVRTLIYGKKEENKKTLVMTHGFLGCSVNWVWMIGALSKKYRLVMFDHSSWGLNTRLDKCPGIESVEAAEDW